MPKKQPKKSDTPTEKPDRYELGARWTKQEREKIDALAEKKGVTPTTIIRMALKAYLDAEKNRE